MDMMLSAYERHRQLCDEVIQNQRALLSQNQITLPQDTEETYQLYVQEAGDIFLDRNYFSLPDIGGDNNNGTIKVCSMI